MLRMETGAELLMANNGASVSICSAHTTFLHAARNKNGQMVHDCSYSWDLNPQYFSYSGTTPWSSWQLQMSLNLKFMCNNCEFRQIKDKLILP